jgi:hypothetical protein
MIEIAMMMCCASFRWRDETSCMKRREKDVTRPIRHGNSGNIVKRGKTKKYSEKGKNKKN